MNDPIRIQLNGRDHEAPADLSVRELILSLDLVPEMIVVERNRTILRREQYADTAVEADDVIELVHFVGGG